MMRLRSMLLLLLVGASAACTDESEQTTGGGGASEGGGGTSDGGGGQAGGGGLGGEGGQGGTGGTCLNALPNEEMPPDVLSQTGLYSDIGARTVSALVQEFSPQFQLWSDAASKKRWIYLPECDSAIDNTNEDSWELPVGTRLWKEFERDGVVIETRLIHRWGPGPDDFVFRTYRWDDADAEATRVTSGELDAKGTEHDIPTEEQCAQCHGTGVSQGGLPSRALGFSAIQLSHSNGGVTMASLSNEGHLLVPNADGYDVPGNQIERDALGYMHANCAGCHNGTPDGVFTASLRMRLLTTDNDPSLTAAYTTLIDQDPDQYLSMTCDKLIDPGNVANSCVHERMSARGADDDPGIVQMPPLGTSDADPNGLSSIEAWIDDLP